jgi:hypothetical protein
MPGLFRWRMPLGMKRVEHYRRYLGRLFWLLLVMLSTRVVARPGEILMGKQEQTFPVLQTKTGTYTNVTVTKQTKDWIFILHSAGVCNLRASDLSTEARITLGYEAPPKTPAEARAEAAAAPASSLKLPHIDLSGVKQFAAGWRQNPKEKEAEIKAFFVANPMIVSVFLGISAVVYIFLSVCFWLICRKTHIAPGPLVWVPFLQLIPLLRAANMPRVWFFGYFLPIINIIPIILLSIKIVKSRGKSPWVAFLLILPPTSLFAFLYLAFSRSAPVQISSHEVLSLETA